MRLIPRIRAVSLGIAASLAAAGWCPVLLAAPRQAPADILIRNARVVHGDGRVTRLASVVIRNGSIEIVQPLAAPARGPGDAPARRVIEAEGLTIVPGLIDAHVRLQPWTLPLFLEAGVTTVRDLHGSSADVSPLAPESRLDRPRVLASGPIVDGPGGDPAAAAVVTTVGEARAAVRRLIESGARVIAVSPRVEPALLTVVVSEAKARGVPVAAHLGRTTATQAADAGVTSIEHLSGVTEAASADTDRLVKAHAEFFAGWTAAMLEWRRLPLQRLEAIARDVAAKGVVMVPTLVAHETVSRLADADLAAELAATAVPKDVIGGAWKPPDVMARAAWTPAVLAQFRQALPILQQFVSIYARVGGRVAAGSGVGEPFVVPGASLHRELELIVSAGLSPAAALQAATADAASLLGIQDRAGTIDAGKAADLVLLDGDPLTDIRNTRRIAAVIKDGVVVFERR